MSGPVPVPHHVLPPGPTTKFTPSAKHPATRTAGLDFATIRALGAHEGLSPAALDTVAAWSADFGARHGGLTPDPMKLAGQTFDDRVGTAWGAHRAAHNAACYPGGNAGRPSYAAIHQAVWVEQRWPELCRALSRAPR